MMLLGYLVPWGAIKAAITVAAFVGLFGTWLVTHDAKVVQKERASVETKGKKTNAKAMAARAAVPVDGSVDRVRSKYCRDCL